MKKRRPLSASALRRLVEERAGWRCEYCHAPASVTGYRFHLDHIIPKSKGGAHRPNNRALACAACNLAKINREVGIDPHTEKATRLFNPRREKWHEHFAWDEEGILLRGLTATGRATIAALDLNNDFHHGARKLWFATGWLP